VNSPQPRIATATCHVVDDDGNAVLDVTAEHGGSLMQALRDAGADIEASCGGNMACGTCLVHLDEAAYAQLSPPDSDETGMLEWLDGRRPTSRLACQIPVDAAVDGIRLVIAT